jgi:O-antigen ligase
LWLVTAPFVAVAVLEAVLGLVQRYWAGNELAQGTYVNRNHYAGLLEMALPFAVMNAVAVWRRGDQVREGSTGASLKSCALIGVGTVILVAIVHSQSRMGFVAALAGLLIVGALWFGTAAASRSRLLLVAGVTMLVMTAFIFLPTGALIYRFADLATSEEVSADTRAQIWRETWDLVEAYPFLGVGLGGYESGFIEYKRVAPLYLVDYAHNDYLQLLAELGVVGFTLLLLLAGRTLAQAFRIGSLSRDIDGRCFGIAAAGSLGAIALHSFVDFNLYIPAHTMIVAWIGGVVDQISVPGL